jgi:hypothetical protein
MKTEAGNARVTAKVSWFRSRRSAIALLTVFAVVAWVKPAGLLLWARIRILTSLPKTAIADDPTETLVVDAPPVEFDSGFVVTDDIRSDPFRIDSYTFPNPTPQVPVPVAAAIEPKAQLPTADDRRLEVIETVRRAAERFRLQSAGRGLSIAVIDGRTYRVGDALEGTDGVRFVLIELLESAAVIEHDGAQFELRLRGFPTSPRSSVE